MTKKNVGKDRPDDYKRFSDIDRDYEQTGKVGTAVPQSEQKSKR